MNIFTRSPDCAETTARHDVETSAAGRRLFCWRQEVTTAHRDTTLNDISREHLHSTKTDNVRRTIMTTFCGPAFSALTSTLTTTPDKA